jgi:hypothetical protein
MTYPGTIGHPKTIDDALDMVEAVMRDQMRTTISSLLLAGHDADDIDGVIAWNNEQMADWRPAARVQIAAPLAAEGVFRRMQTRSAAACGAGARSYPVGISWQSSISSCVW